MYCPRPIKSVLPPRGRCEPGPPIRSEGLGSGLLSVHSSVSILRSKVIAMDCMNRHLTPRKFWILLPPPTVSYRGR